MRSFLASNTENKLRTIVANVADMTIEVNRQGVILFMNHIEERYLDVIGRSIYEFVSEADAAIMQQALKRVFEEGQKEEYEVKSLDGRWWKSIVNQIPEEPEPRALIIATDVTHQRLGEKLRAGQNKAMRKLLRGDPLGDVLKVVAETVDEQVVEKDCSIWLFENNAVFPAAAPSFSEEHLQALRDSPLETLFQKLADAADAETILVIPDIEDSDLAPEHKAVCRRFGRRSEWMAPFKDDAGNLCGVIALCGPDPGEPDETVRRMLDTAVGFTKVALQSRRASEELRKNEERFRTYFDSCLIGIAISDVNKRWIEVNDRFAKMLGSTKDDLKGRTWLDFTHPENLEKSLEWVERAKSNPDISSHSFEKQFIDVHGNVIETLISSGVVHKANKEIDYFVTLVQDMTEQNKAEEAIRKRDEMLTHYDRLATMGAMAAEIAHEIVQPVSSLTTLSNSLEMMLQGNIPFNDEEFKSRISRINKIALNAARVTQSITRFARGQGKSPEHARLNELVEGSLALLKTDVRRRDVNLTFEPAPEDALVFVEDTLIQQVIVNLVRNAVNAMEQNPADKRLKVGAAWVDERTVEVTVADNGPGLDEQQVPDIFDAFVTHSKHGMGLGLAICQSIVASHDGAIEVKKSEWGGSLFRFTLPAEPIPE